MKLYLVRHGQSAGNLPGRMTGWSEHPLTALGTTQARRVAARLAPLGPMAVYASDLPRALDTARLIAAAWVSAEPPIQPPIQPPLQPPDDAEAARAAGAAVTSDRRLREIDLGDYEGRSWDDFGADRALADAFAREPLLTTLPGGESLGMVRERVIAAFEEIVEGEQAVACLVSHDGPIRTILNHVLQVPPERHWALSTSHGGLSLLEASAGWVSVRFVNDTSHLLGLDTGGGDAADAADAALGS
jgi:broad specificity phosphatase PhoE